MYRVDMFAADRIGIKGIRGRKSKSLLGPGVVSHRVDDSERSPSAGTNRQAFTLEASTQTRNVQVVISYEHQVIDGLKRAGGDTATAIIAALGHTARFFRHFLDTLDFYGDALVGARNKLLSAG